MSEKINLNNEFTKSFDSLSIKTIGNQQKSNGKPKRKNSEKRKEKSRKAARERRSQESKIFDQLEALLPIPAKNINHLDKASLVRLAINYLKSRKVVEPIKSISDSKFESETLIDDFSTAKALNGFMLVLSKEGDMVYLSENVDKYLGLTQIDLMGQSIYDFSHPCDHKDIKDILALKNLNNSKNSNASKGSAEEDWISSSFFVRMKCTLTNKGRNLNLKSANYKVIHCSGHLKTISDSNATPNEGNESLSQTSSYYLTTVCEPIDQPITIEKTINANVFISRHSLDMKYTKVDDSIEKILGYDCSELIGKSVFNFFHALDLKQLEKFFKTLFAKGQSQSAYYRFLAKSGGYLWLLTQATVLTDNQSSQPQSVVCVNHVISGILNEKEIVSEEQCFRQTIEKSIHLEEVKTTVLKEPLVPCAIAPASQPSFVSSTKTVFAPRTADMDSGFIGFDKANHMTILSDTEDLTHLAPEAGEDVCVPLLADFTDINFFEEVFRDQTIANPNIFIDDEKLRLNDEILQHFNAINDENESLITKPNDNSLYKSVTQNIIKNYPNFQDTDSIENSPLPNDPFLSYHEELYSSSQSTDSSDPYSSKSNSPLNISSPILSQTSNFFCKSLACEEVSKLNINDKNDFIDDKELEMRAPFIPIDEDFPLQLGSDLHMNYSDANIDELINFDNISDKPLSTDSTTKSSLMYDSPIIQKTNCLEALLQTDLRQKNRKSNSNQKDKQNLNYVLKSDSNLLKSETNLSLNRVQFVYNNINHSFNNPLKVNSIQTNDRNGTQNQRFVLNSTKAQKNPIKTRGNVVLKPMCTTKRPYSSEPPDIMHTICPNDVLSDQSSTKSLANETQIQKRFKFNNNNNNFEINKGNSVLMNLLVNGEDLTNGYSKYSNIDRSHRSSNSSTNNKNSQKFSASKRNTNLFIYEGQDIR